MAVGRPTGRPAVAVRPNSDGTLNVYVSWNGATEVAQWQLRTGSSPATLRVAQTVARLGFETVIPTPAAGWVAVTALDSSGRRLGSSLPVAA